MGEGEKLPFLILQVLSLQTPSHNILILIKPHLYIFQINFGHAHLFSKTELPPLTNFLHVILSSEQ